MSSPARPFLLKGEANVAVAMLAVVMWGGAIWSYAVPGPLDRFGTLKGTDFAQFYVAARFAAAGRLQFLYDWTAFAADLARAIPQSNGLLYLSVYPPQLAILFAPIARLDYLSALIVWTIVSAGLYTFSIWTFLRYDQTLRAQKGTMVLLAVAFPAFQQVLLNGQIGTLALVAVTVAWWAWRVGAWWLAGFALGCLAFKPQMWVIAVCAVLLNPGWRLLAGVACAGLAQMAIVMAVAGIHPIGGYWGAVERVLTAPQGFEPKPWQMHSLRAAIDLLAGHTRFSLAIWILCVVSVLWLARRTIKQTEDRRLQFAAVVIAGLLINPHLYVYDLVVLAVPLCGISAWLLARGMNRADRPLALTAFALLWAPLLGPFAAVTRVQLTSPLLVLLLWQISRTKSEGLPSTVVASSSPSTACP